MGKVSKPTIENNRKVFMLAGGLLGTSIYKVEARSCDAGWENKNLKFKTEKTGDLFLNREIKRCVMKDFDIVKVEADETSGDGYVSPNAKLILDDESTILIPIAGDLSSIGKVEEDAMLKALRGDKNIFFNNAKNTCEECKARNDANIRYVEALMEELKGIKQSLITANVNNEKLVKKYEEELTKSAALVPNPDETMHVHLEIPQK